jgi:hypothetical protein
MTVEENATHYEFGNGRFDLMTDEEVRTLTHDDLQGILVRLAEMCRRGESSLGEERYHQLYELLLRYPDADFRFDILPLSDEDEDADDDRDD